MRPRAARGERAPGRTEYARARPSPRAARGALDGSGGAKGEHFQGGERGARYGARGGLGEGASEAERGSPSSGGESGS
jgi:hypothetical protein